MQPSTSKYIELESISVSELCKKEPGAFGIYIPKRDEDGSPNASIAAISSNSKSLAYRHNKKCVVQQVMLLERSVGSDVPAPVCMLMLTIASADDVSDRGKRYNAANKERLALRKKSKSNQSAGDDMHVIREKLAAELLKGDLGESQADHEAIARALTRGHSTEAILAMSELERWPETYSWLKTELA